jgi:hypothetical protein
MQHIYWTIGMSTEQKKTHYCYCKHVRKERVWIVVKHYIYKHYTKVKY